MSLLSDQSSPLYSRATQSRLAPGSTFKMVTATAALEEGYYAENGAYPENIEEAETLRWIEPNLFTDPSGFAMWQEDSDYSYESSECEDGKCKSYTLRSKMEKEAEYVKTSRN